MKLQWAYDPHGKMSPAAAMDYLERLLAVLAHQADYAPGEAAVEANRRIEEIVSLVTKIFNR